jgi:uncharacterized protein (DUF2141 family)
LLLLDTVAVDELSAASSKRNVRRLIVRRLSIRKTSVAFLILATVGSARTWAQSQEPQESVIHVDIDGLRSDRGQVLCALFSSAADFPKKADRAVAHAKSEISGKHATCEFQGVSPGTYAVSVFHDENSNGKLDTNFLGIPREGVGASNNAKGHFGPPKFSAAAFQYSGGRKDLKITINYL